MQKITKTTVFIFIIIAGILIIGYETVQLCYVLKEKREVKTQLDAALKQKVFLEDNLSKVNLELKVQKNRLRPLEEDLTHIERSLEEKTLEEIKLKKQLTQAQLGAQSFKDKIKDSQNRTEELNKALSIASAEKSSLRKINRELEDKLSITTKEINRAQIHIQALKENLLQIKKTNAPLRKKAIEFSKTVSLKEDKILKLEQEKASLKDQLDKLNSQRVYSESELLSVKTNLSSLQENMNSLKKILDEKESQSLALNDELNKTKSLNEQITLDFNRQLKDLQDTLLQKNNQIAEFSSMKDAMAEQLQAEGVKLTAITSANNFLEKQIEEANLSKKNLEDELNKIREQALRQDQMSASLKENINFLKQTLEHKEKENLSLQDHLDKFTAQRVSLDSEFLNTKIALDSKSQELKQKIQDLENINILYNNLKEQLLRISNLMAQKELELVNNHNEMIVLKDELKVRNQEKQTLQYQLQTTQEDIYNLQSMHQDLRTELTLTKQQHKKLIDELSKAVTLNTSLQQSLVGLSQSMTQEEESRERAKDLKGKVEVILTPQ